VELFSFSVSLFEQERNKAPGPLALALYQKKAASPFISQDLHFVLCGTCSAPADRAISLHDRIASLHFHFSLKDLFRTQQESEYRTSFLF
jgi:hypothetical protein